MGLLESQPVPRSYRERVDAGNFIAAVIETATFIVAVGLWYGSAIIF
ncbi:MAG: hypothetical protein WBA61_10780 [Aequorivita sp.]